MIILKFIQDSDSTADNDRYSFRIKLSINWNLRSAQFNIWWMQGQEDRLKDAEIFIIIDRKVAW